MAKVEATAISDSDNEVEVVSPEKKQPANGEKASMAPEEAPSEEQVDDGSDEGSADGSEYEIESVISAKRTNTGFTYLVSWKGYSADHNSWVEDRDAGNATDLIAEYWAHTSKEKKSRKSLEKPKTVKGGHKSSGDASALPSAATSKKRNRTKVKKDDSDDESDGDQERPKTAKKPRKSTGVKRSFSPAAMDVDNSIGDMEKYMHHESWEKLVKSVDTVEQGEDGKLYVFFTLKADNERHKQPSMVCKKRFPEHMIDFYEGHLRWKVVDEVEDA